MCDQSSACGRLQVNAVCSVSKLAAFTGRDVSGNYLVRVADRVGVKYRPVHDGWVGMYRHPAIGLAESECGGLRVTAAPADSRSKCILSTPAGWIHRACIRGRCITQIAILAKVPAVAGVRGCATCEPRSGERQNGQDSHGQSLRVLHIESSICVSLLHGDHVQINQMPYVVNRVTSS